MHDTKLLTDHAEEMVARGDGPATDGVLLAPGATHRRRGTDALLLLNQSAAVVPGRMQDIIALSVASCIGIAPAGIAGGESSGSRRRLCA